MAQRHVIDELVTLITLQFSPKTRREIQRIERSVDELKSNVRNELQRAGFAMDDFSDDVADMSRESRADLDRTGRATERLGQDVADMSRKVDRELDDSERSFGDLADSAKKTTRTVGAALGTLASVFLLKETSEFRAGIARIDNQLENLNFKQVESAVIRISDLFAVNRDIVALLASQIDTELAPSVEVFESRLTTAVKLQKSLGLEDITHAQRLINVGFIVAPDSEALFADQVAAFLQRVPIVKEEIDGLATGIERAFASAIDPSAYLSLLSIGRFPSQEVAGAVVEDLGRELDEFKREGGVIDLAGLVSGTMDIPDTFGEQTTIYINQVRDMEDAQTRFIQNQAQYNAALGTQDQALRNISEATGDLARWMVWLENRALQVGGELIDLGGAFTGLLPAIGGAALTLQAFGLDLSGIGKAIKGFASAVRHPVLSLQRFWTWLMTTTAGVRTFAARLWTSGTGALGRFATSVRTNAIPALSRFATTIWTSTIGALRALGRRLAMASLAMLRFATRAIVAGIAGVAAFAASIWTGAVPALAAFAAGVWATTVAMLANPVGLIVLGIVALIAALVLAVKHWDKIKAVAVGAIDAIRGAVQWAWNWIKGNWPLLVGILLGPFGIVGALVWKFRDQILGAFREVWDWLRESPIFGPVIDGIQAIIDFVQASCPAR